MRAGRACSSALLLLSLLALARPGCGNEGAGGGGNDSGVSGGAPLDESVRLSTLAASEPVFRANQAKTKAERDAALVAFYRQQPLIEAAGVSASSGNVWARFTDGTVLMHFQPPPASGTLTRPATGARLAVGLPADVSAIAAFSLDPGWTDVTAEIAGYLDDAGYTARAGGLTVDDLMNLSNLGVLFWQTHSGDGELRADAGLPPGPDGGPPSAFAFLTSTVGTIALGQGAYKTLRDNGSLTLGAVVVPAPDGGTQQEPRYGVTLKFIKEQMTGGFAKNSLVAIDSCTGVLGASAFEGAGAARFVSWNDFSGRLSAVAFERLFDRLAGANATPPLSTPKERPFAADQVRDWMQAKGYDLDRSVFSTGPSKAQLLFHSGGNGDFTIIRPTIMRVLNTAPAANESLYRITIEGSFGDDPGASSRQVTYGGATLDVQSWDAGSIIARLPDPPPSGSVQVSVGTHKSEKVPITEWVVPFTYNWTGQDTLKYVIQFECHLRADVRGIRFQPEQALGPVTTAVETLSDSGGSLSASGSKLDSQGRVTETWSGGGVLPWLPPRPTVPPQNFVSCAGFVNQNSSAIISFAPLAGGTFTVSKPNSSNTTGTGDTVGLPLPLALQVDWPTRTVKGGKVDADPAQLGTYGVSATLIWTDTPPTLAPTDQDER